MEVVKCKNYIKKFILEENIQRQMSELDSISFTGKPVTVFCGEKDDLEI